MEEGYDRRSLEGPFACCPTRSTKKRLTGQALDDDQGGLIYTQLWALGRANCDPPLHDHMDDVKTVGPSAGVGLSDEYPPEELSIDDIQSTSCYF